MKLSKNKTKSCSKINCILCEEEIKEKDSIIMILGKVKKAGKHKSEGTSMLICKNCKLSMESDIDIKNEEDQFSRI